MAVTRTTLGRTARTAADASARLSGGVTGGAGPAIDGKGSMRANARNTVRGGAMVFSRCRIRDPRTSSRICVWPGSCSRTAPATHTIARPSAAPATSPPIESSRRSGGIRLRLPRANEPANDAALCSRAAPTSAPARPASGVYGDFAPWWRNWGASREPTTAPAASPPSDRVGHDQAALEPGQRRQRGDRNGNPVDARHGSHVSRPSGQSSARWAIDPTATLAPVPGA